MYLTDLKIQNLKFLHDFHLSFGSAEEPRMWTVLIGENGLCKTAILRAIAMAATGPVRSNQLADVPSLPDRRQPGATMRVESRFTFGPLGHRQRTYPGYPESPAQVPTIRSSIYLRPGSSTLDGKSEYLRKELGRPRARRPDRLGGLTELNRRKLVEELAEAFGSRSAARSLLDEVGFSLSRTPTFNQPLYFWKDVTREIEKGMIEGGLEGLAAAAANAYPFNRTFAALAPEAAASRPPDPIAAASSQSLADWFVAGYGTSRLLPHPTAGERPGDRVLSRLSSLFDRGDILGTGFTASLEDAKAFTDTLRRILVEQRLLPLATGLDLRGRNWARSNTDLIEGHRFTIGSDRWQVDLPGTWLSQGYQSTIAWIADLVGQLFFERDEPPAPEEMEGLVLLDEIDLHLHPRWQVDLIPLLKEVFPRLQFVATTHSPMVLPGLSREEVVLLSQDAEGNVVVQQAPDSPALLTGSEIYETFFGIDKLYPSELGAALQRYSFLVGTPRRSPEENREMAELRRRLADAGVDPGWTPVENRAADP